MNTSRSNTPVNQNQNQNQNTGELCVQGDTVNNNTQDSVVVTSNSNTSTNTRKYGKVILSLHNCVLSDSVLQQPPSISDGLTIQEEAATRGWACELIQTAGMLLRLPQVAMATAQVYLQRFYYTKSLVRYPVEPVAMAAVYLGSKVEEKPCRIRDVINVFHHVKQVRAQKPITPIILDANYVDLKNRVIKAERRILKELGFCVHVQHPHKLIVVYLQVLSYEKNRRLMQLSWNYMNDALRTDVFVRYQPETIACACIYLTARKIGLPLPDDPPWFRLFSVREEDIEDICLTVLRLYRMPKVDPDELEKKIELRRKIYQADRLISQGLLGPAAAAMVSKKPASAAPQPAEESPAAPPPPASSAAAPRDRDRDRDSKSPGAAKKRSRKYKSRRSRSRSRSRSKDRSQKSRKGGRSPPPPSSPHRSSRPRSKHRRSRSRDDKRKY